MMRMIKRVSIAAVVAGTIAFGVLEAAAAPPSTRGCPTGSFGPCEDLEECQDICDKQLPMSTGFCSANNCCFCIK